MKTRIILYQQELLGWIPKKDFEEIRNLKPDFICLPEYFFHPEIISYSDAINLMKKISFELNCTLIGGSVVLVEDNKMFNTTYIFQNGIEIGNYKKINLYFKEIGKITPGDKYKIFEINNIKISILICADVLNKNSWEELKKLKPQIIFIPTFSPFKNEKINEKFLRDENIYLTGAKITDSYVIKVCSVGKFKDTKLQGRSLVSSPEKIIWRVKPEDENKAIIKVIDIEFP